MDGMIAMKFFFAAIMLFMLNACAPVSLSNEIPVTSYVYKIGPGDKLHIAVFGEQQLTGDYAVSGTGVVSFPLVGDVSAIGQTIVEFRDKLISQLGSTYLRNPQLTVEVLNFRPVYILGEVTRPGEFQYQERMSIYALVAKAGGFTYRANQSYIFIRHEQDANERAIVMSSATAVQPGDTIRVPERYF
jgi:polysaccharide biosynthesis/export protein